ncbi:MAG: UDP-4-amino-4,6-dideoxy-N-acetyl-beta-L-altrosamine transaminase [Colwellia sp.]|nr:UDP-4-amino-4,6-dideoxy-N-acetyl-beta-L-altrosamine transaminase [Colwellia sp.]
MNSNFEYIPYGKQDISPQDIEAVVGVLQSSFLTQGPQVPLFEASIKQAVQAKYALAVNSATSALHIACLALGVGKGDVVWTSPITFVATANCALFCGASINFVDIDPITYNLCAHKLEQKLIDTKKMGGVLPKLVIPVHLCGQSCEMEKIHTLSQEYGFSIIEDASHAIGGKYQGQPVGNCQYSDITVFSFHPVKIVTTAEGGVATTNNKNLLAKMELLRSHGITRDEALMTEESHGPWFYQQIDLGFNYRMTELQAALGVSQMMRLDEFVAKRNDLANRYDSLLDNLPLTLPMQDSEVHSARHLYVIRLQLNKLNKTHRQVFEELRAGGIGVNLHYIPLPMQPFYKRLGYETKNYPQSELYYQEAISIPLFYQMLESEQDRIVDMMRDVIK